MPQYETMQTTAGTPVLVSRSAEPFIHAQQDILDLLVRGREAGTNLFMLRDTDFDPGFYDLKTGLAGAILQKIADYRVRLAVVGSFAMAGSGRFRELMAESRKGDLVRFAETEEEAVAWLHR